MSAESLDFLVSKADLKTTRWATTPLPALEDGQVLLKTGPFAFTSNNVTYALFGAQMRYWDFFPAPEGWGRVPVWGFATVAASRHPDIAVGEEVYGYLPMSSHLIVQAERVRPGGFVDAAAHRQPMAGVYNQYVRTAADTSFTADGAAAQPLLRPLFMTSFLIDDFLADNGFFGATRVVLSSASSKTSLGTAFVLSRNKHPGLEVVGLTSPANAAFVNGLGYYDRVVAYDDIESLSADRPTVYVDMAGSAPVRQAVHGRLNLTYSCAVGGTHWDAARTSGDLKGPAPTMFFAPTQIAKRNADWGPGGMDARYGPVWSEFIADAPRWLTVTNYRGRAGVETAYTEVLGGGAPASIGHMVQVSDDA